IGWPQVGGATILVEAPADTIAAGGLDDDAVLALCREHFGELFEAATKAQPCTWQTFTTVRHRSWHIGKTVVMGRAAYNSHFSVGLDIRSYFEDAETLAGLLGTQSTISDALKAYDAARRPKAESLQRAADASQSWFEQAEAHL